MLKSGYSAGVKIRDVTPIDLARMFFEEMNELAPEFGYVAKAAVRVAWQDLPGRNRILRIRCAAKILERLKT